MTRILSRLGLILLLTRLRYAWWAFWHVQQLSELQFDMRRKSKERNSRGGTPDAAFCAEVWHRKLYDLPKYEA